MKKILFFMLLALMAIGANAQSRVANEYTDTVYTVHPINQDQFRTLIAEWDARDWVMRSTRPVVVDFYADWCQPCKNLHPILQELAQYYHGEVDFYRINVDDNSDICDVFQIRSIPFLLICPLQGEPQTVIGLYPKNEYIRVINLVIGH